MESYEHKDWPFPAVLCTILPCKAILSRGQPGLMRWILCESCPRCRINHTTVDLQSSVLPLCYGCPFILYRSICYIQIQWQTILGVDGVRCVVSVKPALPLRVRTYVTLRPPNTHTHIHTHTHTHTRGGTMAYSVIRTKVMTKRRQNDEGKIKDEKGEIKGWQREDNGLTTGR